MMIKNILSICLLLLFVGCWWGTMGEESPYFLFTEKAEDFRIVSLKTASDGKTPIDMMLPSEHIWFEVEYLVQGTWRLVHCRYWDRGGRGYEEVCQYETQDEAQAGIDRLLRYIEKNRIVERRVVKTTEKELGK